jgi:hypothetical protein
MSGATNGLISGGTALLITGSGVTSVFGRSGAVTAQTGDYNISQISGAGTAAAENLSPVIIDNGAGALTIGANQIIDSMLATNTANTLAGYDGSGNFTDITLTTTGSSGAATISGGVLNIPQYAGSGGLTLNAYSAAGNNTNSSASATSVQTLTLGTPGYSTAGSSFAQWTVNANNFAQISLQNSNAGSSTSQDFIVTANNGNDSTHYADFGMNGSGGGVAPFTNANAAYVYSIDNELNIGALGASGIVNFYTTGGATPVKAGYFDASQKLNLSNQLLIGTNGTTTGTLGLSTSNASGATTLVQPSAITTAATITLPAITGTLATLGANTFTNTQIFNPATGIAGYIQAGAFEESIFSNGNSSTSLTIALDKGNLQSFTVTGAVTVALTAPTHPGKFMIIATQDGSGHVYSYSGVKWPSGAQPPWSSTANSIDIASFAYDGTHIYGVGNTAFS